MGIRWLKQVKIVMMAGRALRVTLIAALLRVGTVLSTHQRASYVTRAQETLMILMPFAAQIVHHNAVETALRIPEKNVTMEMPMIPMAALPHVTFLNVRT